MRLFLLALMLSIVGGALMPEAPWWRTSLVSLTYSYMGVVIWKWVGLEAKEH